MNSLLAWVTTQPQTASFLPKELSRVVDPEGRPFSKHWESPTAGKVLIKRISPETNPERYFDPNYTTILGGMCLINTVEMKRIYNREITFANEDEFEKWYTGWYPRIDQIHDAVGIPPRLCKKIVYVAEDSFFAGRLASYTGLNRIKIGVILRRAHEMQGHPVLSRYLKTLGYSGELTCVFTSNIEDRLEIALKMWERTLNITFRTCDRDFAKVEFMYTGFWLDLLGINNVGVIYEAASKMKLRGWVRLDPWFQKNPYGSALNKNLGAIGYVPFLTTAGDGSKLAYDQVPNFSNHQSFEIANVDMPWYIVNLLFTKKTVAQNGPLSLDPEKALHMIRQDLLQYYCK